MGRVILEREMFRSREEREKSKYLRNNKIGSDLKLYIKNAAR